MDGLKKSFAAMRRRLKLKKKYASHPMSLHATNKEKVPDLPIDIITEILSRLPAKSIMKFRIVCKLWKSITTTSYFLEMHSVRSLLRSPNILAFDSTGFSKTISVIDPTSWEITLKIEKPPTECLRLEGSCNGILCIYNIELESIELLNPTTRESITIAQPITRCIFYFHLGFDLSTKKFKVLCRPRKYPINSYPVNHGYIYTVGVDSTWRLFEKIPNECRDEAIYSNGALHCLGTKDERNFIYILDLKDETMNSIDITKVFPSIYDAHLGELEGRIWIWYYYNYSEGNHTEGRINMFMMGRDHDKDQWILKHTIKGVTDVERLWGRYYLLHPRPLTIVQNKKVIFCDWFMNWLTCYELQTPCPRGGYEVCYDLLKSSVYTGRTQMEWDRCLGRFYGSCIAFSETLMALV